MPGGLFDTTEMDTSTSPPSIGETTTTDKSTSMDGSTSVSSDIHATDHHGTDHSGYGHGDGYDSHKKAHDTPLIVEIAIGFSLFVGLVCVMCMLRYFKKNRSKIPKKLNTHEPPDVGHLQNVLHHEQLEPHSVSNRFNIEPAEIKQTNETNHHDHNHAQYSIKVESVKQDEALLEVEEEYIHYCSSQEDRVEVELEEAATKGQHHSIDSDKVDLVDKDSSSDDSLYQKQHQFLQE
eukprot:307943_1